MKRNDLRPVMHRGENAPDTRVPEADPPAGPGRPFLQDRGRRSSARIIALDDGGEHAKFRLWGSNLLPLQAAKLGAYLIRGCQAGS
jgi:hypothetical protein